MPRRLSSTPTEAELEVLGVIWQRGPSTVRQVHNALKDNRGTGYSTTLKIIQLMTDKGLLKRDESIRPQVYTPRQRREDVQIALVDELVQRGFGGSAMSLVMRAVAARRIGAEELEQIRKLIVKAKGEKR